MKKLLTICIAAAVACAVPNLASAAIWVIQDAGLQDSTNFVDIGWGSAGSVLNSRSDIAGDPGTRFSVTLNGSGWQSITVGDNFDLPSNNAGLVAATGNSGDLSGYAGYTMTIKNSNSSGGFMANISVNTGWTDSPWNEPDQFSESGWVWVLPGQTVTLTLDFVKEGVNNLNHVTNIALQIGTNMGGGGGDYEMPSGTAFDVDVVSRAGLWEIQDAGLQDSTNFVDIGWGGGGVLNSRSDITSDPGTRFNITFTGSDGSWQNIAIADNFDLPSDNSGLVATTGNNGDLSNYTGYTMTIKNPNCSGGFMATLIINTGWTDAPWSEPDQYSESGWVWVLPGQTVTLTLDFAGVNNLNHVTNIGLQIGTNMGSGDYAMPSGTAFDVDVVSNVLELNVQSASQYVQTGGNVVVDMDVLHLLQRVNACQAMLGYSSTYFPNPASGVVAPGGGVWDLVIYDSWNVGSGVSGEIDTAIGVDSYGATGTDADGTVAIITLAAGTTEGTTTIVFRPDAVGDDTKQTFLSDMSASAVWPRKYDTCNIVIDGTDPTVDDISATQSPELTPCGSGNVAVQGTVNIVVTASDNLSGVAGVPTVTVTDAASTVTDITGTGVDNLDGTYSYTYTVSSTTANGCATIDVTVTDNSGNVGTGSDGFDINKNQVTGTVSMSTLLGSSYSFNRDVVFKATDGGGVLKTWTETVTFTNNTGTQVASGAYTLTDVPGATVNLSAKTAWSLRERQAVSFDGDMQATNNFSLLGGDINGSNSINILDYSVLKVNWFTANAVADINGDGSVNLADYFIMKSNWFKVGDAQ